jgi:hypothetical protein
MWTTAKNCGKVFSRYFGRFAVSIKCLGVGRVKTVIGTNVEGLWPQSRTFVSLL